MGNNQSTPYDVVIKLDSLLKLKQGVKIDFPGNVVQKEALQSLREKSDWGSHTIVGLLGNYNAGKTFVLNLLSSYSFSSSYTVSTEGLSFKQVSNMKTDETSVFIDTAGLESPVVSNNDDIVPLVDRKSTDVFLQTLVFALADIFVVVLNHISIREQENMAQLISRLDDFKKKCTFLIVVHNWKECTNREEMDLLWKKQVSSLLPGGRDITDEDTQVRWYNNNTTRHVCLAKHFNCSYGTNHNTKVINLIKKWIDNHKPLTNRKYNLIDLLLEKAKTYLEDFVQSLGDVTIDFQNNLMKASFTDLKPFLFSAESGIILGSSRVKSLNFRSKDGYTVLLEMPGMQVKPIRRRDGIFLKLSLIPELEKELKECEQISPEHKTNTGISASLAENQFDIKVDPTKYDTDRATFHPHKGYFVVKIPLLKEQKNDEEEVY